jgi:hypothetical protein
MSHHHYHVFPYHHAPKEERRHHHYHFPNLVAPVITSHPHHEPLLRHHPNLLPNVTQHEIWVSFDMMISMSKVEFKIQQNFN